MQSTMLLKKFARNLVLDATDEEVQKQVQASVKAANSGKGDTGSLVADHTSYAGNYTEETHGDHCKQIDGDLFITSMVIIS